MSETWPLYTWVLRQLEEADTGLFYDMSEHEGEGRMKLWGNTNGRQVILFSVLKNVSRLELSFERKVQENRGKSISWGKG